MSFIIKQQHVKSRRIGTKIKATLVKDMEVLTTSSLRDKNVHEEILDELMRNMKELKIEMIALKKDTRSSTSRLIEG